MASFSSSFHLLPFLSISRGSHSSSLLENYSGSHGAPLFFFFFFLLLSWWWWWWWLLFLLLLFGAPWRMAKQEKLIEKIYILSLSLFPSRALLECSRPPPRPVRAVSATPNSLAPSHLPFSSTTHLFSSQPTNQLLTLYILLLMEISIFYRGLFLWAPTQEDPNTNDDRIGF